MAELDQVYTELKNGNKFFVMTGPCVIESLEHSLMMAGKIKEICDSLGIYLFFKSSYDKANRTSVSGFRGPGLDEGLQILRQVKETYGLRICTDVHEPWQCDVVAEVADIIQIPAFLCRQTDLLVAAGRTGKIIQIKKGQFCNYLTMKHASQKIRDLTGNQKILLCDRGTMFGYGDLVVDFRGLVQMRKVGNGAMVTQDITHALQQPNNSDHTLGARDLVPTIARAAVAVGVDGLFLEVHDDPTNAKSDATTQWPLRHLKGLLTELLELHRVSRGRETNYLDLDE